MSTDSNTNTNSNSNVKQKASFLPAMERISNFSEVSLGYTEDQAIKEASRCLQCKKKFCSTGCPVSIDIPYFIKCIREKNFDEAFSIIKSYNSFPAICGRVCPQENQCESKCILNNKKQAISIGLLERFVADYQAKKRNENKDKDKDITKTIDTSNRKYRVAVVGSGPSSLTVAGELIKNPNIAVDIFEALHRAGGVLVYGIPEFRLPKSIVKQEIDDLKHKGVNIYTNKVIGKTLSLETLKKDYDAVYIGVGAGVPLFLNIKGEELGRIFSANDYLTRNNLMYAYRFPEYDTPIVKKDIVSVLGGGNVAMDAARTALRLGSKKVNLIYRRGMEELPARAEEVSHAIEEGINFLTLTAPVEFISDEQGVFVKKIKCIKMKLGEKDSSGRARPEPIEGSEFYIDTDVVIVAIGAAANPLLTKVSGLELSKKGYIQTDSNCRTSQDGVWAGGDITTGAATVIAAMGAGKVAAKDILAYLENGKTYTN